jgi:predicted glycosyltransferase
MCEVMARARRSIAIPRLHPRREQAIRVEALAERGLVRVVGEHERTPAGLEAALRTSLEHGPLLPAESLPPLDGLARFQRRMREIAQEMISFRTGGREPVLVPVRNAERHP